MLISIDMDKILKIFFWCQQFTDIKEEKIKQINNLKLFDMEPHEVIPKKRFVSEEKCNCKEEINAAPQDRIGNIDWCKCRCECKLMVTFTESFCLLLWLKFQRARRVSCHSALMDNCLSGFLIATQPPAPSPVIFLKTLHQNQFKNEAPLPPPTPSNWKMTPRFHWKQKPPSCKWFLKKTPKIENCH